MWQLHGRKNGDAVDGGSEEEKGGGRRGKYDILHAFSLLLAKIILL